MKERLEGSRASPQRSAVEPSLWDRLRESMERLESVGQEATNADALAQKLATRATMLRGRIATLEREELLYFLAFNNGRERYGIPLSDVLEVQALDYFTAVPNAPGFLPGVTHWRGAVLALIDLGRLFDIPGTGLVDSHICIVVEAAGKRVGVIAEEIEEVYGIPPSRLPGAPSFRGNVPPEWIVGVHDHQRLILNMSAVLQDARLVDWRQRR